jgi:PadR family transcriptional regulator PadR
LNIQLKQGVLEMCILAFLEKQENTGYIIEKSMTNQFKIPEGSIYPLLRRMVQDNYIESYYIEEDNAKKKYFKINQHGITELNKLVNQWQSLVGRVGDFTKEASINE